MNILLATDAFPPVCGGSGWSTYELAKGLRARGHEVLVVRAVPGIGDVVRRADYDGFRIVDFGTAAPDLPYVRNYFKNERLHARLSAFLSQQIAGDRPDVVHAQHVMTGLPSIDAARRSRVPVVCTVRDYWPVCYWSDLIHAEGDEGLCPGCSPGMMTRCIRPRAGAAWPLALPMIPYMRANLARKRRGLAAADAVVAVSSTMAADLRARAPELATARIEIIPNSVDVAALRAHAAASTPPLAGAYALYLGKLAPNKGTSHLVRVMEEAQLDWPLLVAGDGPERRTIEAAAARSPRDVRVLGWVDRNQTAALLAHAAILIFPSRGPESLSRVLLEASALGVPIAAMRTGGTADIVVDGETGLLSETPSELSADIRRLRDDSGLRSRLGQAARRRAERCFDSPAVIGRVEALYCDLVKRRP